MFRKGKGGKIKRDRCASYYDEDVLGKEIGTEGQGKRDGEEKSEDGRETIGSRMESAALAEIDGAIEGKEEAVATEEEHGKRYEFMVGLRPKKVG